MNTTHPQSLADLYRTDPRKACRLALRRTRNLDPEVRMEAVNSLLEMHGTEALRGEWSNGYWCDIAATYANTGDTYALTVFCVRTGPCRHHCRFTVTTLGDFIESAAARTLAIQ